MSRIAHCPAGRSLRPWKAIRGRGAAMRLLTFGLVVAAALVAAATAGAHAGGGKLVFGSNRAEGTRELYVVNGDGSGQRRLTFNDVLERQPVWSPDRSRVAFAGLRGGNWDIYTVAADGSDLRRLTTDPERDDYPKWTNDSRIVFQRGPFECPCEVWIARDDGTGAHRLDTGPGNAITPEPAPHTRKLAFASDRDGAWSLYTMKLDGGSIQQLTDAAGLTFGDFNPRWSPVGNRIAFLRDDNGIDNDLFVIGANGQDLRRLTTTPDRPEFWPSWSPNAQELLFTEAAGVQSLRAVSLRSGVERAMATSPSAPLVEDFDDGVRDASLWHQVGDPGSTIGETGGRLEVSIAGGAVPGGPFNQVAAHYGSQCTLPGDFDFQVDYALLEWPSPGGFYAALSAFFAGAGIARNSPVWGDGYVGWSGPFAGMLPTADTGGSLRLVRSAGTLTAYKRSVGSDWVAVFSGAAEAGSAVAGMGLSTPAAEFQHLTGTVAYDNFRLSSGELACPEWWSDFAGDWS